MKFFTYCILLPACFVLAACSTAPDKQISAHQRPINVAPKAEAGTPVSRRLNEHFVQWRGVPYQMGGLSQTGIDCSGFVVITFRDVFEVDLPRTSDQLATLGRPVKRAQLNPGDLLIFKTGFKQKHVGIYVGGNQFIHASTSSGVMTSHLTSPYWADAYRDARRVVSF